MNILDRAIAAVSPSLGLKRLAARQQLATLGAYQAAEYSRSTDDWRPSAASADLAILGSAKTLNARARQLSRDNWIVASMIRAARRNIINDGIIVTPSAYCAHGESLDELNAVAARRFHRWATDATRDIEGRQTFYEKQSLLVEERYTVGEAFIVWTYEPSSGENCGLRFQTYEAEQLNDTIISHENNQVRGGIELDENHRPVAYHFYLGNPNDYLLRNNLKTVRIPADRVLHYYRQERVRQSRGVTPLAPVMSAIREFGEYQESELMSARMQACVGAAIKKNMPMTGLPTTQTTGTRKLEFYPGMVAELAPGEEVQFLNPTHPASSSESFTAITLRGIAAGLGMSYGLLSRHFDGNYSVARQDMLEDDREWGPEQKLFIRKVLEPMYRLWFSFMVTEGRFDDCEQFSREEYASAPQNFYACDAVVPPKPWIDPEKEANARTIAVERGWITNEQVVAEMGGRYRQTWAKLAKEYDYANELGLNLPQMGERPTQTENTEPREAAEPQPSQPLDSRAQTVAPVIPPVTESAKPLTPPGPQEGEPGIDQGGVDNPAWAGMAAKIADRVVAMLGAVSLEKAFRESDHPRNDSGEFSSGGGSGGDRSDGPSEDAYKRHSEISRKLGEAPDQAVVNTPMDKRGNIDAQIDKHNAEKREAQKARATTTNQKRKEARDYVDSIADESVKRMAEKSGKTPKQVREWLRSQATFDPDSLLKLRDRDAQKQQANRAAPSM